MARKKETRELNKPNGQYRIGKTKNTKGSKEPYKITCLILEGETEKYYFNELSKKTGVRYRYSPKFCPTTKLSKLEDHINKEEEASKIFCVFDLDRIYLQNFKAEEALYLRLKEKYTNNPKVVFCESLPSFELWLLLHYDSFQGVRNKHFKNQEEVIAELCKDNRLPEFKKGESKDWFEAFFRTTSQDLAIQRAKSQTESNYYSFTNIYKIFEELVNN